MSEIIILCTVFGVFILISFITGLYYGSRVKRDERIEIPNINPIKIISEKKKAKEETQKRDKEVLIEEINLANIENYDGTDFGQIKMPQ